MYNNDHLINRHKVIRRKLLALTRKHTPSLAELPVYNEDGYLIGYETVKIYPMPNLSPNERLDQIISDNPQLSLRGINTITNAMYPRDYSYD